LQRAVSLQWRLYYLSTNLGLGEDNEETPVAFIDGDRLRSVADGNRATARMYAVVLIAAIGLSLRLALSALHRPS
jgi:hypothetical protein